MGDHSQTRVHVEERANHRRGHNPGSNFRPKHGPQVCCDLQTRDIAVAPNESGRSSDGNEMAYVPCCLLRSVMISYTPPLTVSFPNRSSGPASGRSQAAPVDDMLRSVAAKMIVPPTRSIGTRGIPAVTSLFSIFNKAVSVHLGEAILYAGMRAGHGPVKNGWMTATRIFFCANG